ncbi:MBL fold metallo-hydrolase [Pseudonocardia sp. WMMC193]|uniref:MBL fold metallo-hydrolase n=1 Tax=Pseudonocardia sp. WMMC193 TaxID=2911965 RepID=UPI001F2F8DDD|nr:MBL fold metallo-hydrolase [Pseudonocardia sp. WMMC193]MCF7550863.1 MBL fold metallo-hydrolase [Pseudonocardia sp. WMMC193]
MTRATVDVTEVAPGVHRMALPLGVHGLPSVSAYLLHDADGDVLVDCGIAAGGDDVAGGVDDDSCGALDAALRAAGGALGRVRRLVVTHAHVDHFGLAGEVVRRSGGELWMHEDSRLEIDGYRDPDEAVDRRELLLADHGLDGPDLARSAAGLRDWMTVMPSIGVPDRLLSGGERLPAGGRTWEVLHTPGHSPGHVCLWSAADRVLCSGDHLLQIASPPVTFERGFEPDPMGRYLDSLDLVAGLGPELVLPGHGPPFPDGARRARAIAGGKRRRLDRVYELVQDRQRVGPGTTVTELAAELVRGPLTAPQRHLVVAEILAHLAWFETRGVLGRARRADGVFLWRTTDR